MSRDVLRHQLCNNYNNCNNNKNKSQYIPENAHSVVKDSILTTYNPNVLQTDQRATVIRVKMEATA